MVRFCLHGCEIRFLTVISLLSPGRFFVANELKAMLAYLVVNYDIELEEGTVRSEPRFVGLTAAPPSTEARIRLRKRAVRA